MKKIDRNVENLFFEVENISTNVSKKEKKMANVFSLLYKQRFLSLWPMFSSVKLLLRREELQLLKEITNLEILSFDGDLNQ